jgi:DNA-binding MarR family transcriptional regulator
MRPQAERELQILTAIEEGRPLTQRALAERLGVALGLANLYVKRLAKKGYIKTVGFPRRPAARKRLRYLLTPKGLGEKTRLTYEHMAYALSLYRRTRQTLRDSLAALQGNGITRVAFYGTGEAAELADLTLREFDLEPADIYAAEGGGRFLGRPVRPLADLRARDYDVVVVATFEPPETRLAELERLGVPRAKLLTLRRAPEPGVSPPTRTPGPRNGRTASA